jgi:hypothetical protein
MAFRASHAELVTKQTAIRQGLVDRLQFRGGPEPHRALRVVPADRLSADHVSSSSGGWAVSWRPDKLGYPIGDGPSYNDMPPVDPAAQQERRRVRVSGGVDAQGNNIADCLEIDSDDVTPKALAELAMAAVRITKRHREAVEDMAGYEETASSAPASKVPFRTPATTSKNTTISGRPGGSAPQPGSTKTN